MADLTWNLQSRNFSPIHNILQGPIAERPAAAELNTVYLSTDEADGALTPYWYDGSTWEQCNGIEGFTDAGGSSVTVEALSVTENNTYTAPEGKAYSPVTVNVSSGTNPVAKPNDVNFIDYDGTIRYSYSAADFANLSALPANPAHDGLTARGWNWSLADAKTYVASYGKLWIGQMYVTTSGNTEIDIVLNEGRLSPYLGIAINGTVSVDWGDGSTTDTVTGTSLTTQIRTLHNYASAGAYTITISVTSGSFAFYGSSTYAVLSRGSSTASNNRVYANAVQAARIGQNVTSIGSSAFYNCTSLASITIPPTVTSIGSSAFQYCYRLASITVPSTVTSISDSAFYYCTSLASITIPSTATSIGNSAFYYCTSLASITAPSTVTSISDSALYNCYSLASITIPSTATSIGNSAFQYCYGLASITVPSTVTSIGSSAFQYCYGLGEIHFESASPPTVGNSNTWAGVPADCIIYVPTDSLSDYTSATNYPSSSTYTYVEE